VQRADEGADEEGVRVHKARVLEPSSGEEVGEGGPEFAVPAVLAELLEVPEKHNIGVAVEVLVEQPLLEPNRRDRRGDPRAQPGEGEPLGGGAAGSGAADAARESAGRGVLRQQHLHQTRGLRLAAPEAGRALCRQGEPRQDQLSPPGRPQEADQHPRQEGAPRTSPHQI